MSLFLRFINKLPFADTVDQSILNYLEKDD